MRVAVIGAGITGLTAAYRLVGAGHECDVYERWPGLGGQVASFQTGSGERLEHYYHHLFTSDRAIVDLHEELGLADAVEWLPSSVAIFAGGRTHPFNGPIDLLRFGAMSPLGRLRMGAGALALQRVGDGSRFERMTARTMVERWMGPEAWRVVWGPLMAGKFADRAAEISAAWLWSKLNVRRRVGGRQTRGELLGYPRGGWQPLLERLAEEIRWGGRVLIDRPVATISRRGRGGFELGLGEAGSWRRGTDPGRFALDGSESYDAVLATVPSNVLLALLDEDLRDALGGAYRGRLETAEYAAALCLLLELERPFGSFYWTNVADPAIPFVGLIEQTRLVGPERYGGRHYLYVANYLPPGHPLLALDPGGLLGHYEQGLRAVRPGFDPTRVLAARAYREDAAQPIVTPGYGERIPALRTPVGGLLLANTTQIYPEDRGTNYGVLLGERAVVEIAG